MKLQHCLDMIGKLKDKQFFIKSFCPPHIFNGEEFKIKSHQKKMIEALEHRFSLIWSARVSHKTTTALADLFQYSVLNSHKTLAYVGLTVNECKSQRNTILNWIEENGIEVKQLNSNEIHLANDSKILFVSENNLHRLKGRAINYLLLDEFCYFENGEQIVEWLFPMMYSQASSKIVIITSGTSKIFKKLWRLSFQKQNPFHRCYIPWYEVEGNTYEWAEQTKQLIQGNFKEEFAADPYEV